MPCFHHDHSHEFLVIYLPIVILVGLGNQVFNVSIYEKLPDLWVLNLTGKVVGHCVPQLSVGNRAIAVSVEHLEYLQELIFDVRFFHHTDHEVAKLKEANSSIAVSVYFENHVLYFGFIWVLAELYKDPAQVFSIDCVFFVDKAIIDLLKLVGLFLSKNIYHNRQI